MDDGKDWLRKIIRDQASAARQSLFGTPTDKGARQRVLRDRLLHPNRNPAPAAKEKGHE